MITTALFAASGAIVSLGAKIYSAFSENLYYIAIRLIMFSLLLFIYFINDLGYYFEKAFLFYFFLMHHFYNEYWTTQNSDTLFVVLWLILGFKLFFSLLLKKDITSQ